MDAKKKGVLAVIGASAMWALEPVFAKMASEVGSDFVETSAVRAVVVAATALIYILATRGKRASQQIGKKQGGSVAPAQGLRGLRVRKGELHVLLYIALAGTVFADLMYLLALMELKTPVINAVVIGHMQPVAIVLIGFFMLKEDRLTGFDYAGIAIMIGAGLLVTSETPAKLTALLLGSGGDALVLLATIAWSTTAIAMRKHLTHLHAGVVTFYRFSIASVIFAAYLVCAAPGLRLNVYQVLVGVVVGVGTLLYYEGLKRIKAAQVSALELSAPFFAAALGFLALGEDVTIMQICGMALLFLGVRLLSRKEHDRQDEKVHR